MRTRTRWTRIIPVATCLMLAIGTVSAQQSLTIGNGTTAGLSPETLTVTLTNTATVEGFVLAVGIDPTLVEIDDVNITGTVTESTGAELVVPEILPLEGFTLGVVLDATQPFDAQQIPIGTDQPLANFTARPITVVATPTDAVFTFLDGTLNNPPLDNIIVQMGQSIGANQGLGLIDGGLTLEVPPPDQIRIEGGSGLSNTSGSTRILMTNQTGPVQGFVLAIAHDETVLDLEAISIDGTVTSAAGAELFVPQIFPNGGTLGLVLDFQSPFDGQTIPIGADQHIATYVYSCDTVITEPAPPLVTDLLFVDGVLNSPPLDNVIVVGGLSLFPDQVDGTYTCLPTPVENTRFLCGPADLPDTGSDLIEGAAGGTTEVCFYYDDPDDNIQGFQLAVCFDCNLSMSDFSLAGSIIEEVGTEFVNYNIDNDPNDGDGCEFVAGILLDALPPFENQTAPPSFGPLLIGCLTVEIAASAPCDIDLPIEFCEGVNGNASVELGNIVVIDFESVQNFEKVGCSVRVAPEPLFQRGDCNSDDKVDLADAATVLGQQFSGVSILCPDACDANDDGKINLADSIFTLLYLYSSGSTPPDPGPENDGPDPTEDELPFCESDDSVC